MKYYIIAGEASGDLHASNLIRALKKQDDKAEFRAWGGDLMEEQGAHLVKHYRDLAFMGVIEVLVNIRAIYKNIRYCKDDILSWQPDVLILVDYPGFNLRMAKFAHKQGIKVLYYISPKVWAWKKSRVYAIKKNVDKMLIILPFEEEFYAKYNYPVDYVGHPLLDAIPAEFDHNESFRKINNLNKKPIIAILPGSRKQEIAKMLEVMVELVDDFPDYQFAIAAAPAIDNSFYHKILNGKKVALIKDKTYQLLNSSTAALVTSGTATLETALIGVPQVVCYKVNSITYHIGKLFVDVPFISLVNLIMNKEVVKELLQYDFTSTILKAELNTILFDVDKREAIISDYKEMKSILGKGGASEKAADEIIRFLKN
ncbi:MAG: lipid-A-disaccharide synthase [Bacteroidales bacterium]|nr:lipid-A-disaccharide synthase [Bacteroidales bacterium]